MASPRELPSCSRWLCRPVIDTPQIHRCGLGTEPGHLTGQDSGHRCFSPCNLALNILLSGFAEVIHSTVMAEHPELLRESTIFRREKVQI